MQQTGEKHPTGARCTLGTGMKGTQPYPRSHEGGNQEPGRCLTCPGRERLLREAPSKLRSSPDAKSRAQKGNCCSLLPRLHTFGHTQDPILQLSLPQQL